MIRFVGAVRDEYREFFDFSVVVEHYPEVASQLIAVRQKYTRL